MKPSHYIFLRSERGGSLKSYIFLYEKLPLDHGIQKLPTDIWDYDTYFPSYTYTYTHTHTHTHTHTRAMKIFLSS